MSAGRVVVASAAQAARIAAKGATRPARVRRSPVELTERAIDRLKYLLKAQATPGTTGFRLGVKSRGCNGMSYTLEFNDPSKQQKLDEEVVDKESGVSVVIEPKALMFVLGTKMDYEEDESGLKKEFVFLNPNATATCGCGESFSL